MPVLLGPTAVGKTTLAVELAARLNAEIISGDSMQFYRWLDIGTAKIRPAEMIAANGQLIPHHLIDIRNPEEPYSVADFQQDAARLIAEIQARGRLPLLVGGTALYIQALADNYSLNEAAPTDETLRQQLHAEYCRQGAAVLHQRLAEVDPTAAARISPNDEKRLIRALEVWQLSGRPISEQGKKTEPMELAYVDVPDEFTGVVIEKLSQRRGTLLNMGSISGGYTRLEFRIPSRGLIGYRSDFLTDTKGNGILNTIFDGYNQYCGDIQYRKTGSLIAFETGESVTYGLFSAQDRGTLFIGPGEKVYAGMVIGMSAKAEDIELNVCKKKHLTNTRSSSADEALTLVPPKILSLEQALEFIDTDELLEITPESIRIRKRILDPTLRKRANMK